MTTGAAAARCRGCVEDADHCHEVLVRHADGSVECLSVAACVTPVAGHDAWIACVELVPACVCGSA